MKALKSGIKAEQTVTVTEQNTAAAVGSGTLPVFGTPALLALMEGAACDCVASYMEGDETTVGVSITLEHMAPSPLGATVTACAVLEQIDGRRLVFAVTARDQVQQVGKAVIERFLVGGERFVQKANSKQNAQ